MIIKRLRIHSFGKLKNLEVKLQDGFNIVFGENEAGKSTMQTFIKSMFYGMNSAKKSIKDNERKKLLPWNGDKASGELYFEENGGNEYIIYRSFGASKKEDDCSIVHSITGNNAAFSDITSPGKDITGLGEEAFEKTFFIKQLGAEISRDKDDEIMKRLSNLEANGDEDISYHNALRLLEEGKKALKGLRKNGMLDNLTDKKQSLLDEKRELARLHEESIEDYLELNNLKSSKEQILSDISRLEKRRKENKSQMFLREYYEIKDYRNRIDKLQAKYGKLEVFLSKGEALVDEEFIQYLKGMLMQLNQKIEIFNEKQLEREKLTERLKDYKTEIEEYSGFEKLDEAIDTKVAGLEIERRNLEEKQSQLRECEMEYEVLEKNLSEERDKLGELSKFENLCEEEEQVVHSYEERLKEIKIKLESIHQYDSRNLKYDILKGRIKNFSVMSIAGGLIGAAGLVISFIKGWTFIEISLAGVLFLVYCIVKKSKFEKELGNMNREILQINDRIAFDGEMMDINATLSDIYDKYNVKDYSDFAKGLRQYNTSKSLLQILKAKLEEKKIQIDRYNSKSLIDALNRNKKFSDFILNHCNAENMNAFMDKLKNYKDLLLKINDMDEKLSLLDENLEHIREDIKKIKAALNNGLECYIESDEVACFDKCINNLERMVKEKYDLLTEIKTLSITCEALLKGREFEVMEREARGMAAVTFASESDYNFDDYNEDSSEVLLKEKNNLLIQTEKSLKDRENSINNRFNGRRDLSEVEEELAAVEEKIKKGEEGYKSLEIAAEIIKESFLEIQKSFGPRLNEAVRAVLEGITDGRYRDIKISEDFEIKVEDPLEHKIKEIDYLSGGTWEQIYFSLRMGIINLLFKEENSIPIILDDTFVMYDDNRLNKVLNYLYGLSKKHQIILFTCQKREVDLMHNLPGINMINL